MVEIACAQPTGSDWLETGEAERPDEGTENEADAEGEEVVNGLEVEDDVALTVGLG